MALFTGAIADERDGLRWKLLEGHDEIATVGLRALKALCHDGESIDHRGCIELRAQAGIRRARARHLFQCGKERLGNHTRSGGTFERARDGNRDPTR
jgi:hypothetical protein